MPAPPGPLSDDKQEQPSDTLVSGKETVSNVTDKSNNTGDSGDKGDGDTGDTHSDGIEEVSPSQEESLSSFRIFFILCVLLVAILMVYLLIKFKFHYLPESIAIVILGKLGPKPLDFYQVSEFEWKFITFN